MKNKKEKHPSLLYELRRAGKKTLPSQSILIRDKQARKNKNLKITVVIPTYNEKDNIEDVIRQILDLKIKGLNIIIVDDNSPDGTGQIAERLKSEIRSKKSGISLDVIHRKGKQGIGTAYAAGFKKALKGGADYIISMDADLSHNPKDIPGLLCKARQGYDLVLGSRYVKGGAMLTKWNRRALSRLANIFTKLLLRLPISDCTAGFKCYSQNFIESLNFSQINSVGYAFQVEMVYNVKNNGFTYIEIPIIFTDRSNGDSKVDFKEISTSAKAILKLSKKHIIKVLFY